MRMAISKKSIFIIISFILSRRLDYKPHLDFIEVPKWVKVFITELALANFDKRQIPWWADWEYENWYHLAILGTQYRHLLTLSGV